MSTAEGAARKGRPTPSSRLLVRLRTMGLNVPEGATIGRVYAGHWQRSAGAWSWTVEPSQVQGIGSLWTVTGLLRVPRLIAVWSRQTGDWEVQPDDGVRDGKERIVVEPVRET